MTKDKSKTGRKTRKGKPFYGRKASKDALVYKVGFVVGMKRLRRPKAALEQKVNQAEEQSDRD